MTIPYVQELSENVSRLKYKIRTAFKIQNTVRYYLFKTKPKNFTQDTKTVFTVFSVNATGETKGL